MTLTDLKNTLSNTWSTFKNQIITILTQSPTEPTDAEGNTGLVYLTDFLDEGQALSDGKFVATTPFAVKSATQSLIMVGTYVGQYTPGTNSDWYEVDLGCRPRAVLVYDSQSGHYNGQYGRDLRSVFVVDGIPYGDCVATTDTGFKVRNTKHTGSLSSYLCDKGETYLYIAFR